MRRYVNPHFKATDEALEADFARMRAAPKPLARPVVLLGGWHSPGVANWGIAGILRPSTSGRDADFLSITYPTRMSVWSAAEAAYRELEQRGLHNQDVDMVGISMGGVVARGLATNTFRFGDIRVKRVFTIASPHRGAKIARAVVPDPAAWQMRPGSDLICSINNCEQCFELHCYGVLRDWWIGASNTAPPGMHPYWVDIAPGVKRLCTHFAVNHDRLVIADMARRLRGEEPLAEKGTEPPID
jgi:pimeloyl-ACP methyl ester carboxylesterase